MKHVDIKLNETQSAYLAGLVDGEGCLDFYKIKNKSCIRGYTFVARLQITNTNLEVLIEIAQEIGIGKIVKKPVDGFKRRPAFNLMFSPREVRVLLPLILPYLRMKKRQAKLLIAFLDKSSWKNSGKSRLISDEEDSKRESLFQEMKTLNRRGASIV